MKANFRIVSEIFEGDSDYPAVTHIFRGETPEKARAFLKAHLATDFFFKACVVGGRFRNFSCREQRTLEQWHPIKGYWVTVGAG